jgi:tetratricopeptide (TPR) repeat protein
MIGSEDCMVGDVFMSLAGLIQFFPTETPFILHEQYPSLVFKARVFGTEYIQQLIQSDGQQNSQPYGGTAAHRMVKEADAARKEFEREGNMERLEQAILQLQTAVDMIPDKSDASCYVLNILGKCLRYRFEQLGNLVDIEESIKRHQETVDFVPDNSTSKPVCLTNLGVSLLIRFNRLGDRADLEQAISRHQEAVNLSLDKDPNKPACLDNLGNSLQRRFEKIENIIDLDNAIARRREAVSLLSDDHPDKPFYLFNLGTSLKDRFQRLGKAVDLDEAIKRQREAANLIPDCHPYKLTVLSGLANSIEALFDRLGDISDLDDAIAMQQKLVSLTPDSSIDKSQRLRTLGMSLRRRFLEIGDLIDINDAIIRQEEALSLTPEEHPEKADCLSQLGACLNIRYQRLRNLDDIDNAISNVREAVNMTSGSLPIKSDRLTSLGSCYFVRFIHLSQLSDAQTAIHYLSAAGMLSVGPPTIRFLATRVWISLADEIGHESLLRAYECAIDLMPLVAWLGLPIADRHEHLVKIGGIIRDAVAAAISVGQYEKALEWLEQGRSIVWTQILRLRTPVDELREVSPDLADRLVTVSMLLDRPPGEGAFSARGTRSMEEEGRQYRALTKEWESIIEKIRLIPNFESFLRSHKASQLMKSAEDGPVVVLNVAEKRCDALAIIPGMDDVVHIPLPDMSSGKVTDLCNELKNVLYSTGARVRGERAAQRVTDENPSDGCQRVLAEIWSGLVKPVMDSLAFSVRRIHSFIYLLT